MWDHIVWVQQPNGGWVLWAMRPQVDFWIRSTWSTYRCVLN